MTIRTHRGGGDAERQFVGDQFHVGGVLHDHIAVEFRFNV
jgi:hypothetical protein